MAKRSPKAELLSLTEQLVKSKATHRLSVEYAQPASAGCSGGPYDWQEEWHNAGADNPERMIIAANRTGKTRSCGAEVAIHLTGEYPEWWQGRRFSKPTSWIVAAPTNELVRDVCQLELFGPIDAENDKVKVPTGEGWIPKACIGKTSFRQCGIANVFDTVRIKHISGGWSSVSFKSFEQGYVKFQGVSRHGVWLDEEPDDYMIYTEAMTRLIDKQGIMIFSRTPLFGMSDIVTHFLDGGPGIYYKNATWDDSPHLSEDEKARLLLSYPEWQRDARTRGIPMLGEGAVFTISDSELLCDPFEIPAHFRQVCGVDFGISHPAAGVWIAHDPDRDIVYVTDCYKATGETSVYHAEAIKRRGKWIPVSWPHDGLQKDKASGVALMTMYLEHDVNMLHVSARYDDKIGGAQAMEPSVIDILERMRTGRFKVFSNLSEWMEEKRLYHRKDGRIVREKDDLMSATKYAVMMLRYAETKTESMIFGHVETTDDDDYDPLRR